MHQLRVYQSLWAMEELPGIDLDGDLPGGIKRILDAGFNGVGVNLARTARVNQAAMILKGRGLDWEAQALVRDGDELARRLDQALALGGAHHLNIQIANGPATLEEACALVETMLGVTRGSPLPVFFETHRGRLTNDLFLTTGLLRAFPDLRLTGDLSHYATTHEMILPIEPQIGPRMDEVIARCAAFHLRVAGAHQIQVSIEAPQHAAWRDQFYAWWAQGMRGWLSRARAGESLAVMCELGPPNYAITGLDGRELTNRWREALLLKDVARAIFAEAIADQASSGSGSTATIFGSRS